MAHFREEGKGQVPCFRNNLRFSFQHKRKQVQQTVSHLIRHSYDTETPGAASVRITDLIIYRPEIAAFRVAMLGDRKGEIEILPYVKVHLVANTHPLQVNPGIGLLRILESWSLANSCSFPDNPSLGSRAVMSSRT